MTGCAKCGQPVEFRFMDGRPIPLHFEGGCSGSQGATGGERVRKSDESSCIRTKCLKCFEAVFFIRHNGGSVWIDPPLGPPWYRHGCMDMAGQSASSGPGHRTSIVDAGLNRIDQQLVDLIALMRADAGAGRCADQQCAKADGDQDAPTAGMAAELGHERLLRGHGPRTR